MSAIVYRIQALLEKILGNVPTGTNLGLMHLFLTILSGRLLSSRGALFPALTDFGLEPAAVRRAVAAVGCGHFQLDNLVDNWGQAVAAEGHFHPHIYEGVRPVACDLVGFFRPQFEEVLGKHYHALADKALPAVSVGVVGALGSVGAMRLALPRAIVTACGGDLSETALKQRTIARAATQLQAAEAAVFEAGFEVEELVEGKVGDFVVRAA